MTSPGERPHPAAPGVPRAIALTPILSARYRPGQLAAIEAAAPGAALVAVTVDGHADRPLPASSPPWDLPSAIVTPHTSWSSGAVLDRSVDLFCENLRLDAAGQPLVNVVDPAAGY